MKDDGWLSRMKSDPINYSSVVWRNICCYSSPDCHIHDESHALASLANIGRQNICEFQKYFLWISVHISYFDEEVTPEYTTKTPLSNWKIFNKTYKISHLTRIKTWAIEPSWYPPWQHPRNTATESILSTIPYLLEARKIVECVPLQI